MSLWDGIGLLISLIPWYFSAIIYSLIEWDRDGSPPWLMVFGVVSIASIVASVWLTIRTKTKRATWILLPLSWSFVFVFISGLFRGQLQNPEAVQIAASGIEIASLFVLVWLMRKNWVTGLAQSVFCGTIWLMALFISTMSFRDDWL